MKDFSIDEMVDKCIAEEISPILIMKGFKLKRKRLFQRKIGDCKQELSILVRNVRAQNAGYVEVCPGFVYDNLEKLVADLKGEKLKKGWLTVSANIGNLRPEGGFMEWPLGSTTNVNSLGILITNCVTEYAFDFWESFSTIKALIDGYEERDKRLTLCGSSYKWRMAAAYCIDGNPDAAIRVLEKWENGRPSSELLEQAIKKISGELYANCRTQVS